jgi:Tfp pilus assembly protein PilO
MQSHETNLALKGLARKLNLGGACVAGIVLLACVWLVLGPLTRASVETASRLATFTALVRDEGHLRAEHGHLRRQLEAARQQEAALKKRIPDGPQEADFLLQISHAAAEVGLQITDYRPGVMTAGKSCSAMRVELSCEGNYRSICRLLNRLRELPRHSTVARLDVNADGSSDKYLLKLGLELYFFGSGSRQLASQ